MSNGKIRYVDFGNSDTWPKKLRDLVVDHAEKIEREKEAEWENLKSGKSHYNFISTPIKF
jgi:hypothetical protein